MQYPHLLLRELPRQLPRSRGSSRATEDLEQWLVSIHPSFATYATALKDYGYEDLGFLRKVDEADFEVALTEVGMTKPAHRALALKQFRQLV